ncbi:lytic transglycosylase domain-containing protein [Sphingobium baderi]|uniref:lytic transglycosylase domain-containing protein n=1 Tax=Sphingobium baderi TaxID=1332080 RepID=UPI002B406B91|nr:lytic transglycosylase domain-containing protein [Sphingobium baderi]WRD78837.1 lytic transglycosylase domain-containing protein [Sphingobium baderi]
MPVPLWMQGDAFGAGTARAGCLSTAYRPAGFLDAQAEARRAAHFDAMHAMACEFDIPVGLFDALIMQESAYRPRAISRRNAFGLAQLMPDTATELGVDRYDVAENLRGGAKYLRAQLDRFGQYHLALAAYNAGPGRVRNGEVPQIAETQRYVAHVLGNWARLAGPVGRAMPVAAPAVSAGAATRWASVAIF